LRPPVRPAGRHECRSTQRFQHFVRVYNDAR